MTRPEDDAIPLVVYALVVFVIWTPHLYFSLRQWRRERTPRAFRSGYIAVMLQIGLLRAVTSTMARAWPDSEWIQNVNILTAPLLTMALISGAFVALWTWRRGVR